MKRISFLATFLSILTVFTTDAQTVKLYSITGILKSTYTTLSSAYAAASDGDSMVASPNIYYENSLGGSLVKKVVLQGTISGTDTTTVDAQGKGACITSFYGTIRDVVLTGGAPFSTDNGGAIVMLIGNLKGYTTVRNNKANGSIVQVTEGVIGDNVKIINNVVGDDVKNGTICVGIKNTTIRDNVIIAGNRGGLAGAVFINGIQRGDTSVSKIKSSLKIEGNVKIENNEGSKSGAIFMTGSGCYAEVNGSSITGNRSTSSQWAAAIAVDSGFVVEDAGTPYDSISVPYLKLNKVHIYNPLPDGGRQVEIRICNRKTSSTPKPGIFNSEGTWFGDSDTTGLIVKDPGTRFAMPNWSVAHWFCIPTGSGKSNVVAQMRLNTGAPLPASSLKTLKGQFTATAGSFSAGTVSINSGNEMLSNYTIPSSPFVVTASVDADTFRPNLKELSIKTLGFEQVKIYPNPATDIINVSGTEEGSVIALTDMTGRIIAEQEVKSGSSSIFVNHLSKGIYLMNITTKDGRVGSTKIIKE